MDLLSEAFRALPSVAGSPLAFVAYIVTIAAWLWGIQRSRRLNLVLNRLDSIPRAERAELIRSEMGAILPTKVSAEEWLRGRRQQYLLAAYTATAVTVLGITAISAWKGSAQLEIDSVQQVLAVAQDTLELSHLQQTSERHRYTFDITVRNPSIEPVSITDIRIIFDPGTGGAIASVQEISGTYFIRVSDEGTDTEGPVGRVKAYAWYPSGRGSLIVKSPLAQKVEPRSVDRFRVTVEFPEGYQFRGAMKEAALLVMWNDERYERSKSIKLAGG